MNKKITIFTMTVFVLTALFLVARPSFTKYPVYSTTAKKIKLGYCPTMQNEAISLSQEENYELINFDSASAVLSALKNNKIDKALIGRKAKHIEINPNTKETTLKKDYTLVSNKKSFIHLANLSTIKIHTYIERDFDFPIERIPKEEVLEKIKEGDVALISWEDWRDDFELIVVMNGHEKVKDFRGMFLYET